LIPLSDEHVSILRAEPIVRRVEYVKYPQGNEYWVTFREDRRLDMRRFERIVNKHDYRIIRFGGLPSKLPKGFSELLWNGVTHVVVKEISGLDKLKAVLGFEPEGIARIAEWGHGHYQIFGAGTWEGLKILFDYLDLEMPMPPPAPAPPKPAAAPPRPAPGSAARPPAPAQTQPAPATPPGQAQTARPMPSSTSPAPKTPRLSPTSQGSQATPEQTKETSAPSQAKAAEKKPEPAQ
jgi:hypothetical protein